MKPAPRLLDDPELEAELRADLGRSVRTPSGYDAVRGAARLQAALDQPLTAAVEPDIRSWSAYPWPWIAGLLLGLGLGAALWLRSGQPAAPPAQASCPCPLPPAATACICPPPIASNTQPVGQRSDGPIPELPPSAAGAASAQRATRPPADPSSARTRRELAQLARVHALIDSDPRAATRQLDASDREYRGGTLQEERDALRVIAHCRLGERARAETLASIFQARYPHSPLRERMQRELRARWQP